MFSNFKEAFITRPQYNIEPPKAVIETISDNLPDGFYYVYDHDGICRIENNLGITIESGVVNLPEKAKDVFLGISNINSDLLMQYAYNAQTEIEIVPDSNGCFIINGKKIKANDIMVMPMSELHLKEAKFYMHPPAFPDPFDLLIGDDKYELCLSMQRKPHNSLNTVLFETVEGSPLYFKYLYNFENKRFDFTISTTSNNQKTVCEIVKTNHIFNSFMNGKGKIEDTQIDVPISSKDAIPSETIEFWEMLWEIENKLEVKFKPTDEVYLQEVNKVYELYRSIIQQQPFKKFEKFSNVNGAGHSHLSIDESLVGKDLYFEFEFVEEVRLFEVELNLYSLVGIFEAVVESIELPDNDEIGNFKLQLMTKPEKEMYSSTRIFVNKEELRQYREYDNHIKELRDAEIIEYLKE